VWLWRNKKNCIIRKEEEEKEEEEQINPLITFILYYIQIPLYMDINNKFWKKTMALHLIYVCVIINPPNQLLDYGHCWVAIEDEEADTSSCSL